jgi:hypothetical protein
MISLLLPSLEMKGWAKRRRILSSIVHVLNSKDRDACFSAVSNVSTDKLCLSVSENQLLTIMSIGCAVMLMLIIKDRWFAADKLCLFCIESYGVRSMVCGRRTPTACTSYVCRLYSRRTAL